MEKEAVMIVEDVPTAFKLSVSGSQIFCDKCGCYVFTSFGKNFRCNACRDQVEIFDKCVDCQTKVDFDDQNNTISYDADGLGPYCEPCYGRLPDELKSTN